jgi:Mg/Co/Ni transporter MgtE
MEDFNRDYVKEYFARLTPSERQEALNALPTRERQEVLQSLPPQERLAGLSKEQIQEYLDQLCAERPVKNRKPGRKR